MEKLNTINRREFLRRLGLGSAVVGASVALQSCTGGAVKTQDIIGDFDPAGSPFSEDQLGEMTYRINPNNGDKVSLLGYGMMRLPQTVGQNQGAGENSIDQEQTNKLVKYALDHGVNYFDTSPAYGKGFSEWATGTALKQSGYPRKSYYIATKLSNFAPQDWTTKGAQDMFHRSLKFLQTDYIDYLLLHSIGGTARDGNKELDAIETFNKRFMENGILDWLVEQKKKGVIRNLGFSYHGDVQVFDMLMKWHDEGRYHFDFAQIQMNYVDWLHAKEQNARNVNAEYLYTELNKRGIPAVIMEPLLGGRLSRLPNHVIAHFKSREPQMSSASWAFRFCGHYEGVLTALSGMTYMEHLQDNVRTYSPLKPLTDEDLDYLEEAAQLILKYPLIPCNDCNYCMPCPYGLNIPAIFVHYNKCVNEGSLPAGAEDPNYAKMRRDYLISYDRAVPRLRQADHCVGCNQCEPHCPQNIRISRQMERINKFVEDLKQNA